MYKGAARQWLFLLFFLALAGENGFAAVPVSGAALGGRSPSDARQALIRAAEGWLGTRYRYGGADRAGMDCSGLIFACFRQVFGVEAPRTAESIHNWTERIPESALEPGDLVFFVTTGRRVSHAGIYAGDGRFIHSASDGPRKGVIYSGLDETYWRRTFAGAGRAFPPAGEISAGAEVSGAAGSSVAAESSAGAEGGDSGGTGRAAGGGAGNSAGRRGFFAGGGIAWSWGSLGGAPPSFFRGVAAEIRGGCRGFLHPSNEFSLELRPVWDAVLGVFRISLCVAAGTGAVRVFGGPALSLGDPALETGAGERLYDGSALSWEAGIQAGFPLARPGGGALRVFAELCWQHYPPAASGRDAAADLMAATRASFGMSYTFGF